MRQNVAPVRNTIDGKFGSMRKKCKRGVFVMERLFFCVYCMCVSGVCVSRVCVVMWCSMFKLFQLLKVQRELKLDNIAPQLRTIL